MPDGLAENCSDDLVKLADSLRLFGRDEATAEEKLALVRAFRSWLLDVWRQSRIGLTWPVPAGDTLWALFDAATDAMTPVDMVLHLLELDRPIDSERDMFVERIGLVLRLLAQWRSLPT